MRQMQNLRGGGGLKREIFRNKKCIFSAIPWLDGSAYLRFVSANSLSVAPRVFATNILTFTPRDGWTILEVFTTIPFPVTLVELVGAVKCFTNAFKSVH